MSVSIQPCPSCHNLLLDDTVQCPHCGHILDPDRVANAPRPAPPTNTLEPSAEKERPCPNCGQMVRDGLVRCFACGTIVRKEIAETYERMQQSEREITYSIPPAEIEKAGEVEDDDSGPLPLLDEPNESTPDIDSVFGGDSAPIGLAADDDDFEVTLAPGEEIGSADSEIIQSADSSVIAADDTETEMQASAETPAATESGEAETAKREDKAEKADADPDAQQHVEKPSDELKPDESDVPHSVRTGGDALLDVALREQSEAKRRRRTPGKSRKVGSRGGILVFCPNGHRIEVQEKHRGKTGRCPKCKSPFFVPEASIEDIPVRVIDDDDSDLVPSSEALVSVASGRFARWMHDVHFHQVDPAKLKLKPSSMAKTFQLFDLGFTSEELLFAGLTKPGLIGGGPPKKREALRNDMLEYLREEGPVSDLPIPAHHVYSLEQLKEISVVLPTEYAHESMFAGVPVFGEGRIAVVLPKREESKLPEFLVFCLSEFRVFAETFRELYGITDWGADVDIPLTDTFSTAKCHYTDGEVRYLENISFYQSDPNIKLEIVGRMCAACGLIVSEDSRKKEKIGGKNGKGIAKAKCPKCKQKFGDITLYEIAKSEQEATDEVADPRVSAGEKAESGEADASE